VEILFIWSRRDDIEAQLKIDWVLVLAGYCYPG
jgi:hypothetical protein